MQGWKITEEGIKLIIIAVAGAMLILIPGWLGVRTIGGLNVAFNPINEDEHK